MVTKGLLFCLALCALCVGVYSWSVFENMKDLKEKTNFGKYFPRQGLLLLCWLLCQGQIDQNGKLHLNFNPAQKFYGFHEYKNYDLTIPDLSNTNFRYFSLGNLLLKKAKQLPEYIMEGISTSGDHPENNIDRVVIQVQENPTIVDKVYITQHAGDRNQGSDYVNELTYLIGEELLKEIAMLCRCDEEVSKQNLDKEDPDNQRFLNIQKQFQKYPHLHSFLYKTGYNADNNADNNADHNANEHANFNSKAKSANIKLKLGSTWSGKVRIVWDGIPDEMLKNEIRIGIYKNEDEEIPLMEYAIDGRAHGEIDTDLDLNSGLQLRLLKSITVYETVYESPEFDSSKSQRHHSAPSSFFTFISLVLWPFRSLFSLVFFILSNLFSLVYSIFSIIFSLIYFIVTTPFSLVYIGFRELFSLAYRILSFLNSSVIRSLLSLVYVKVSSVFPPRHIVCHEFVLISALCQLISVVLPVVLKLCVVFICIMLIGTARQMFVEVTQNRTRAAPHFVDVSQGRPSF